MNSHQYEQILTTETNPKSAASVTFVHSSSQPDRGNLHLKPGLKIHDPVRH